jgi:hypothetical protein
MVHRSLHAVIKVYCRSMSCFATNSPAKTPLVVLRIPQQRPLLHYVIQADHKVCNKVCHMYDTKNDANPHSTEQDTQAISFLISKQIIPCWTSGGTCCPGVSTPKIRSLANSSTTCHDGINHLQHSNRCSNHSIDPHMINSHLDGWGDHTL